MGPNGAKTTLARGPDPRNGAPRKAGMPAAHGGPEPGGDNAARACPSFALMRG
jgi:hypothetical protein